MDMYERTQRNPYFDFLRGIAMIMVVGIHTFAPLQAGEGEIYDFTANIVRQALNCAVPLFLALAGYFSAKWLKYNRGGHCKADTKSLCTNNFILASIFFSRFDICRYI